MDTEHKGEVTESTETLVGTNADQNHNNGVVASSDGSQNELVRAATTKPSEEFISEECITNDGSASEPTSSGTDTVSEEAPAEQVASPKETDAKVEVNHGERQTLRFLILSGVALDLLRKAGPDLGHIGIRRDTMDQVALMAVQGGEVPNAPRDAEQLETSDVALVEKLMIAAFAHVRGRHVTLSAITDATEVTCSAMSPTGVIPAATSAVKSMGRIGLPDRAVIEARRRMEAETLDDVIASIPSIAPFLESSETYTEEIPVDEDGDTVQVGEKIQDWFDRLSAIIADPSVSLLVRKNVVRSAMHNLATELLKPEIQQVTGFTLNRLGTIGINLGYLKKATPKEESERRGLYLPLTIEEGGKDRWKRTYCVPAFPNEPMGVIHLLRDLQRKVDKLEGR